MLEECLGKVWDGFNAVEYYIDVVKLKEFLRQLQCASTFLQLPCLAPYSADKDLEQLQTSSSENPAPESTISVSLFVSTFLVLPILPRVR